MKFYKEINHSDPPCERCYPGIDERNIESWNAFQAITIGSFDISSSDIIAVAEFLDVSDRLESYMKIKVLIDEIRSLRSDEWQTKSSL